MNLKFTKGHEMADHSLYPYVVSFQTYSKALVENHNKFPYPLESTEV